MLSAGESRIEQVTLKRSALETQTETVRNELKPGLYRFVLLGTDPFLAVDFRVKPAQ